jgi:hypothetical protein
MKVAAVISKAAGRKPAAAAPAEVVANPEADKVAVKETRFWPTIFP